MYVFIHQVDVIKADTEVTFLLADYLSDSTEKNDANYKMSQALFDVAK